MTMTLPRRGVALLGALVALVVLTALMTTVGWHILANHRLAERRLNRLQSAWLARAGIDLAAARLLEQPEKYRGETLELLPGSKLRITVEAEKGEPFRVRSEARYPADGKESVARTLAYRIKRLTDQGRVRVELQPVETDAPR